MNLLALDRWHISQTVRQLTRPKLFWVVLAVKLVMGSALASYYLRDLFVPFLNYFVESGLANPWAHFAAEGRLNSFPYPPLMLYLVAVPRLVLDPLLPSGTDVVTPGHLLVSRLPLLAFDFGIALVLARWFPHRVNRVLWFYWASPFVLYISYWHGQLDVIPTGLFLCALYFLRQKHPLPGLVVYGLALATKSHLLVALPFLAVYVYQERGLLATARGLLAAAAAYAIVVGPFLSDPAFRRMVYGTEEQARLFAFQLPLGTSGPAILLAPAAIVVLWFRFVAYTKRNWDLFMLYLGILFATFILLAPPAPGYFLWSLPFLVHYLCRTPRADVIPYAAYAATYLAFFWLGDRSDLLDAWRTVSPGLAALPTPYSLLTQLGGTAGLLNNLSFTVMQASLAGLVLNMYLIGVRSNAVYRRRTTPILVGVAGDSGSGKDTFGRSLASLLGAKNVRMISGDDYHRWPRGDEMWQVYTHLDVRASSLDQQSEDAIALRGGRSILKGSYDHRTGTFTERDLVDPNDVVLVSGLHALTTEPLRAMYDLKVFMDPDEGLRRFWKTRRDALERGYSPGDVQEALNRREGDRERFILPQREQADLVIGWRPLDPLTGLDLASTARLVASAPDISALEPLTGLDLASTPQLTLELRTLNGMALGPAIARLREVPTLAVEHVPYADERWQTVRIEGMVNGALLGEIAAGLIPNLDEITVSTTFSDDLEGCVQLFFLMCLSAKLRWSDAAVGPLAA